jgi:dihydropteroate synthase
MGILNTTPDSFSDGGQFVTVEAALSRTADMLAEGATIIDIGGESTRPGADPVSASEERDRVVPVIEAVADRFPEALLSIDTYKPSVAEAALCAGAHIVNDVTGLRHFPETADVAAAHNAPLILMHSAGEPGHLTERPDYDDLEADVFSTLRAAIETAVDAGVRHIVTDPGFGFGKSVDENLQLVNRIDRLLDLGYPVLAGISRKSPIGKLLGSEDAPVPTDERLYGTLGTTAVALVRGATIIRTHDVRATREMLMAVHATITAGASN